MRRAIETGDVIWSSKRRNLSLGQFTDNACQVLSRPDLVCDTVNGEIFAAMKVWHTWPAKFTGREMTYKSMFKQGVMRRLSSFYDYG